MGAFEKKAYKEIAFVSGKGGTGKSSITAAILTLLYKDLQSMVIADCDVDTGNLYLLLNPAIKEEFEFLGGKKAIIDPSKCIACDLCYQVCRFDAVSKGETYSINPYLCDGCGFCEKVCPVKAIKMEVENGGKYIFSTTRFGNFVYAFLEPGEENSGKLVTKVRKKAMEIASSINAKYIVIDGPPGIGCPVIATLTGVNLAVIVTEPTLSAFNDFERIFKVAQHFKLNVAVIINKVDMNPEISIKLREYIKQNNIPLLGEVPFSKLFAKAQSTGKTIIEFLDLLKTGQLDNINFENLNISETHINTLYLELVKAKDKLLQLVS